MSNHHTTYNVNHQFETESGYVFSNSKIAYKTWGKLNHNRDNAVVIFHALTGNAAADDWFHGLFSSTEVIDPAQHFIICINTLGSCYGTTGPTSINPKTGERYRGNFPPITIRDIVRHQQILLDALDIRGIEFVIGPSMGGMQALEFCIMDTRARAAILVGMSKAHSAWAIGISHAQRNAIKNDPNWNNGYYSDEQQPKGGLATARMMAMLSYRSFDQYQDRFGRSKQPGTDQFQVESYLDYQGKKLTKRFDAWSYIRLTEAMDSHDIARGPDRSDYADILSQITIPVLLTGISSDNLYPPAEQKELAQLLPNSYYQELDSPYGHDAFLIEFRTMNHLFSDFLENQFSPKKSISENIT